MQTAPIEDAIALSLAASRSIYRIDSFDCPPQARRAFEDRLAIIHGYFDTLPGCLYNRVVVSETDEALRIVTVVEWRDKASLEGAKAAVAEFYRAEKFEPAAFLAEHGIKGNFGTFRTVPL